MQKLVRIILLLATFALIAAAMQTVYVQSAKAKVMQEPKMSSQEVLTVDKGTALEVLESKGGWVKVKTANAEGWVSRLLVGSNPPSEKVTVFTGEEQDIGKESRRRASAVTSAAAARGLTEDDRSRLGFKESADYSSLDSVDQIKVTDDELMRFSAEIR